MELVVVTGMSGAGKTVALKMLEDMGFYCVDNLPIPLMKEFVSLLAGNPERASGKVALGIDIRSGQELPLFNGILNDWRQEHVSCKVLFLDCSDEVLIKRYKETRRSHPLAGTGRIDQGIVREREKLAFLKDEADYIFDTSKLLTKELRHELEKLFVEKSSYDNLFITVLSFGFKYGIPADADLVFDVRFLPNPFYVEDLKKRTGEDGPVREYVMQGGTAERFLEKLYDMVDFLIPNYVQEGKNRLVIAIGCTGGRHRSVTIADAIYRHMRLIRSVGLKLEHRDMERNLLETEAGTEG